METYNVLHVWRHIMYLTTQRVVNPHKQRKRSMKGNRDLENYVKSVEG